MIEESFLREIMSEIMSDDDELKRDGAGAMADVGYALDISQAKAFAEALAKRAAVEPDSDVQEDLLHGILELTMKYSFDPAVLQPLFDLPKDQLTEDNAGYIDDFIEYRSWFT